MEHGTIVIIGGGAAGMKAAQTLRAEGFQGAVTIVGADPEAPYQRPPLSKGYLMGEEDRASVFFEPAEWYAEHDIELRTAATAMSIDRTAREVALDDGTRLPYDQVLIATGSRPRALSLDGAHLPGVHELRTLADAEELKSAFAHASHVAVVGAGWIGLEVAAAARSADLPVTVLESAELPLVHVLGPQVAEVFAALHRKHGVDLRCGVQVSRFLGSSDGVSSVELADGVNVSADLVVVGVGADPNVELAAAAGLTVDGGVVVDEYLRTADPRIWAAGDVASAWHPVLQRRIRVAHIENALGQGPAAARSMLGIGAPYTDPPYFYTDQYDLGMEYIGYVAPGTDVDVVLRGDVDALAFMAFWLSGDRVLAGMHVNLWDATDGIRELVVSGRPVDRDRLADSDVPLEEV
jgi:3-phenylpropionate/trans-cinnamate dioxygenase ferredoxin reductase subunit